MTSRNFQGPDHQADMIDFVLFVCTAKTLIFILGQSTNVCSRHNNTNEKDGQQSPMNKYVQIQYLCSGDP